MIRTENAEWHMENLMEGRIAAALHLHEAQFPLRKGCYAVRALVCTRGVPMEYYSDKP